MNRAGVASGRPPAITVTQHGRADMLCWAPHGRPEAPGNCAVHAFKDEPHEIVADALIEVAQTYGKTRAALDERAIQLFVNLRSVSQYPRERVHSTPRNRNPRGASKWFRATHCHRQESASEQRWSITHAVGQPSGVLTCRIQCAGSPLLIRRADVGPA